LVAVNNALYNFNRTQISGAKMAICSLCGAQLDNEKCTNSLCRESGKPVQAFLSLDQSGEKPTRQTPVGQLPADALIARARKAVKHSRHEALFPFVLLLLWLLLLRGIALPLGGVIVAGFSLLRIRHARKLIRENIPSEMILLESLSMSVGIAWTSVLICIAAIAWSLFGFQSW
jgi:hypothetical protein